MTIEMRVNCHFVFPLPPLSPSQWEPVTYFDNKIICDLVEEKHKGIIAVLVGLASL